MGNPLWRNSNSDLPSSFQKFACDVSDLQGGTETGERERQERERERERERESISFYTLQDSRETTTKTASTTTTLAKSTYSKPRHHLCVCGCSMLLRPLRTEREAARLPRASLQFCEALQKGGGKTVCVCGEEEGGRKYEGRERRERERERERGDGDNSVEIRHVNNTTKTTQCGEGVF